MWEAKLCGATFGEAIFKEAQLMAIDARPLSSNDVDDIYDAGGLVQGVYSREIAKSSASYRATDLFRAKIVNALLSGANLSGSNLRSAEFAFSRLSGPGCETEWRTSWQDVTLSRLHRYGLLLFRQVEFHTKMGGGPAVLAESNLDGCVFFAADLNGVKLPANLDLEHHAGVTDKCESWPVFTEIREREALERAVVRLKNNRMQKIVSDEQGATRGATRLEASWNRGRSFVVGKWTRFSDTRFSGRQRAKGDGGMGDGSNS